MALNTIIKLLESGNDIDCIIGYKLLRKKYKYLPLWVINIIILHKYNTHISIVYLDYNIYGGSDGVFLHISGSEKEHWINYETY